MNLINQHNLISVKHVNLTNTANVYICTMPAYCDVWRGYNKLCQKYLSSQKSVNLLKCLQCQKNITKIHNNVLTLNYQYINTNNTDISYHLIKLIIQLIKFPEEETHCLSDPTVGDDVALLIARNDVQSTVTFICDFVWVEYWNVNMIITEQLSMTWFFITWFNDCKYR
jgi:hypothetical protein